MVRIVIISSFFIKVSIKFNFQIYPFDKRKNKTIPLFASKRIKNYDIKYLFYGYMSFTDKTMSI